MTRPSGSPTRGDLRPAARLGEFDRVRDQIEQRLLQPPGVAAQRRQRVVDRALQRHARLSAGARIFSITASTISER